MVAVTAEGATETAAGTHRERARSEQLVVAMYRGLPTAVFYSSKSLVEYRGDGFRLLGILPRLL